MEGGIGNENAENERQEGALRNNHRKERRLLIFMCDAIRYGRRILSFSDAGVG